MSTSGMSLSSLLPAPAQSRWDRDEERMKAVEVGEAQRVVATRSAPPYMKRMGWIPRTVEDFGDGGSFPEVHVAQYPLNMGRDDGNKSNALAVQLDATGKVKYDVLARQGARKDKFVYSKFTDLLPAEVRGDDEDPDMIRPDDEEIKDSTEKTRQALEKLTNSKITAAMPVRAAEKQEPAQYIRYTPSQQGSTYNSGAKQRIIRMVEVQKDPMEPARFKINKKVPRGPPSPPAPVMHSPTRKVTAKEQQDWKIPPCISNWKNAKGYTIPLDKRLAADGRGLQQVHINENFSKLAEALYIADRKAREAVDMRANLEKKIAQKEKEAKESKLRELAQRAREERAGLKSGAREDEEKERDDLRYERHKERARQRNLDRAAPDRRSKLDRERDRDVSEQIALGLPAKTVTSGEGLFDARLFNQSKGMDSGFNDEDHYSAYDQPWRKESNLGNAIYRPSKNLDADAYGGQEDLEALRSSKKFVPDKGFSGASGGPSRSGPVEFQKDTDDPFGLDAFLHDAKKASKRSNDDDRRKDDRFVMEENLSSPEDLESDFDEERSAESEPGDSDGEGPGMLEVPSRLSFTRSCSQYSSSSLDDESSAATKVRRRKRRRRKRRGLGGVSGSSQNQSPSKKTEMIEEAVRAGDRDRLSQLAVGEGGLLSDEMRLLAWPRLLGINLIETVTILPGDAEISQHGEYNQVVLDVNRSLKRFPPGIEEAERPALQEQLTRLIVRVLIAQPSLHYYQGYHDVAITFLLVVGEHLGYQIMERLSVSHLRKFMAPSMEQTMELLQLIYPIIKKTSPDLHSHLVDSELGTVFALPWLITWFGHVLPNYCDVVRLYDFFLAGPPLMPIYLAAAIVLHREEEILSTDCEMSAVHGLLSRIPVNLPFETLLVDCQSLYERFPPFTIQAEAERELARQREERERQIAGRRKPSSGGAASYRQLLTRIVIFSAPVVIGVLIWRVSQS